MDFDRRTGHALTGAAATHDAPVPGKQTLTQGMVQMHPAAASSPERSEPATAPPVPVPAGPRTTLQMLFGGPEQRASDPDQVHAAAARGTSTAAAQLPHLEQIQRSFGRHDVSGVQAHVGGEAAASAQEMGAAAYATGNHVVLGAGTDLHTVAHEAAHVVQQRGGVQLKGGVGEVGDTYERHADQVADAVVRGESAEALLDTMSETGSRERGVQSAGSPLPIAQGRWVQRLGPDLAQSNAGLVAPYNALLASAAFQTLNTKITTNANIILLDSSLIPGQPVDYNAGTHTIRVPLNTAAGAPRAVAEVRDDILWEMHNASIRGALGRSGAKFDVGVPGPGSSREDIEKYPYQRAAFALCTEWEEWINVVEHDLRTQAINADPAMGAGGPHVTRTFAAQYAVSDAGWFLFKNYLQAQIATGHTTHYDGNAANADWKGHAMVNVAAAGTSSAYLKITQQQVTDYRSGKTSKVKSVSNNPFKNEGIITTALGWR